jgi:hypothetical protein
MAQQRASYDSSDGAAMAQQRARRCEDLRGAARRSNVRGAAMAQQRASYDSSDGAAMAQGVGGVVANRS